MDSALPTDDTPSALSTASQDQAGSQPASATPPADSTPLADNTPPAGNVGVGVGEPPATPPPPAHPVIVDDGVLSQAELDYFVDAAIARWAATGLAAAQLAALERHDVHVADMSGLYLGSFTPAQITLDADAAGHGWFLDGTPLRRRRVRQCAARTRLTTDPTGAPAGHYDLLTTVMHEMGHALGLEDCYDAGDARRR